MEKGSLPPLKGCSQNFKDNGIDLGYPEESHGFVDCIRVFDVALNSTTANLITNSTDTCYPFPDTSIPVPIRIFDLNGNATDLKGGSDLVLSDGGTGLNSTGWNFSTLASDGLQLPRYGDCPPFPHHILEACRIF